ncbi:inactive phospholipase C-like protein 1 [Oppia nitens]|uniref:inactive phospholipase C-like protein 1 n=1 Tax=Oppia nitens TaxID=1686743 RepID=UPI0023DB6498|nr:inactive phospholipase C-like protein 1 [Oppia nitens]
MSSSVNVTESHNKVNNNNNNCASSDVTTGAIVDDSNQSTSSSTALDQTHSPCFGSNGSDPVSREAVSPESEDGSGNVFNFNRNLKQTQKSVCFHSVTAQSGEKKVSNALDCLQHMMNGSTLIKVKASSRQYRRFFTLEEDLSAVRWLPSSKKSSKAKLSIRNIREVRPGKNTEVMKNKEIGGTYSEDCIFSVIHSDDFESLDLIALSPEEANIWVTGLNFLIGLNKSPESLESRQKMREKWLHQMFDAADSDQKGMLDEWETIALMKKLNDKLCIRSLKQKIMEFEFGKDEEERGRISKKVFITLFTETATRPDIYFILVRYCGRDYMSVEDLQLFLEGEQGVCGLTIDECLDLIEKYEPSEEARHNKQLLIDGFTQFLLSEECDIMSVHHKEICHDMSQPLSHYFISTSHNTYLLEDQLKGPSSCEGYAKALLQGCRCVKVDCYDGTDGPVVYHGNTLTSKVGLEDVLETIHANAFVISDYPLIIHLENHCSLEVQKQMVSMFCNIFGSSLYIPRAEEPLLVAQVSPEQLRGKILIKGKKLPSSCQSNDGNVSDEDDESRGREIHNKRIAVCKELSDLISLSRIKLYDFSQLQPSQTDVNQLSEALASKLALTCADDLAHYNKTFMTQVIPDISRVDSSNVNPLDFWNCGIQLVAMNYQTGSQMMDIYRGWFTQNGSSGYVLKPAFLRERFCLFNSRRKDSLPGIDPLCIRLKIISGQQLPRPRGASSKATSIDPYVLVQLFGVPADCAEARTRTVSNDNPIFDESFEFNVTVPELALLRFVVLDDDYINDDFIGQNVVPVECIQSGYKHMRLYQMNGECLPIATIFVQISLTHRYGSKQKLRRKRSWSQKQSTDLRSIGVKAIDEQFKSASLLINESIQLRRSVEKAIIDLCDECSLQESANMAQCLRVATLRLASTATVNSCQVVTTDQGYPLLSASGELTPKLMKTMNTIEKAVSEFYYVTQNANTTIEMLSEIHETIVTLGDQLPTLCTSNNIKGRKADKIAENFMWNMSVLKTEMDLLKAIKNDCECAIRQVERLGPSLKSVYERERESISSSLAKDALHVPVLTGATLTPLPEPKLPPPSPLSPGEGRLRSILKKTSQSSSPSAVDQNEIHFHENLFISNDESNALNSPKLNNNNNI